MQTAVIYARYSTDKQNNPSKDKSVYVTIMPKEMVF